MFHAIGRRSLPDTHIPRPCVRALLKSYSIGSHRLQDAHMPRQMCACLCWCIMQGQGDSGIAHPTMTQQYERTTIDIVSPLPTSTKSAHATTNTCYSRVTSPNSCHFLVDDIIFQNQHKSWFMVHHFAPCRYAHAKTHACRQWLMLPFFSRRCLHDINITRLMYCPHGHFYSLSGF